MNPESTPNSLQGSRTHLSSANLTLLESSTVSSDTLANLGNFIRPDEDVNDFSNDLYSMKSLGMDEIHKNWKVYTVMKNDGQENSRRLENMAWRLEAKKKLGLLKGTEALPSQMSFSPEVKREEKFKKVNTKVLEFSAESLLQLSIKHGFTNKAIDELLNLLQNSEFKVHMLPDKSEELRTVKLHAYADRDPKRPVCALFTHSLERNGANNFCLFLVQRLLRSQPFVIFAPKEGPMRTDFEALGLPVTVFTPGVDNFEQQMLKYKAGMLIANTIMRCDIVMAAQDMGLPTIWMIHESWPKDKLEYYAQEVFLRKDLTKEKIESAFRCAQCVVFPSSMQKGLYTGLYRPDAAKTIYNGIPLERLDQYRLAQKRSLIRSALGYSDSDFLVLHIGTICSRKGQVFTAQACSQLIKSSGASNLKCLMVGARYIRDHEIKYIENIKSTITDAGLSWARYEDTAASERGNADFTLMDIQSDVLRFYLAADVVVVASLNEVLPLVICEAMAFKIPVVASRIDAIPEALTDGVEGFLVPPGQPDGISDAVWKLYESSALRKQMGEAGRKRVESQFSYQFMCSQWREMMDRFLSDALAPNELAGKTVLVDMDNTLVDWDAEFITRYAAATGRPLEEVTKIIRNRSLFEIENNFPEEERELVLQVVQQRGFFRNLKPYPHAVQALKDMLQMGVDVRIVTSPHPTCPDSCAAEKYQFLAEYFDKTWIDRLVIARDKTYMYGHIIVDDKPRVSGKSKLVHWTQVLFNQPYNLDVEKPRLVNWSDWKEVLGKALNIVRPKAVKFE